MKNASKVIHLVDPDSGAVVGKAARFLRHPLRYVVELGEVNEEPSCTVPDMSLGVREILQRYASGRPLSVSSNLFYTGDEYTPDVRNMDLVELEDMRRENAERIAQLSDELKKNDAAKKDAAKKAELKKELVEELRKENVRQMDIEEAIVIAKEEDKKKK